MDRLEKYRELIRQAICLIASEVPPEDNIRTEMVCDDVQGHYELIQIGWNGASRIHGILFHCDIYNDKIYLEHNGTDIDIPGMFLDAGIPASEIVLGFHHPPIRHYTEFALA